MSARLKVGQMDVLMPSTSPHASLLLLGSTHAAAPSIPFTVSTCFGLSVH